MARFVALLAGGLALLCAVADAQGFVHASLIWDGQHLIWTEIGKSAGSYVIGFSVYFLAVIVFKQLGINAPEVQTAIWFVFTIIGVGVLNGRFLHWDRAEQLIARLVLRCMTVLLVRTGEA